MKPIFLITFIIQLLCNGTAFSEPLGKWKQAPSVPSVRTEVAVALLDGKIYVLGGFTPKGVTDQVEVWDPTTGKWESRSPLPHPLHHTTATVVDEKLYVIGGFHSGMWTPVNTVYEYDPQKDKWREKAPMPTARGALAAGALDGKIYAVGGALRKFFGLKNSAANEVYDPKSDRWSLLAPIPTPRDHLTVSTHKGKLYAIGGRIDVNYNHNLGANEAYDPKSNQWTPRKPLPTPRSGITSQTLDGKILVFGGESGEGTFTENEAYDPETDSWKTLQAMPEGRHGLGSVEFKGEIHLLNGGPHPGGGGSATHSVFSIK